MTACIRIPSHNLMFASGWNSAASGVPINRIMDRMVQLRRARTYSEYSRLSWLFDRYDLQAGYAGFCDHACRIASGYIT